MTLTTEQLRAIAEEELDACATLDAAKLMARELLANREAQPVQVTDGMALDFHRALTDGDIGKDDLEEIKAGLRAALCNVTAPPAPANAVGYFLRYRVEWHTPSKWSAWAEIDEVTYDNALKIIATGEADAGRFYEARILYDAPPAPAVPDELLDAMEEVIRISDRDHEAWDKAKAAITACRAAMLAAAPEGGNG